MRFRKWVTGEVLPALRKRGRYEMTESGPADRPSTATELLLHQARQSVAFAECLDRHERELARTSAKVDALDARADKTEAKANSAEAKAAEALALASGDTGYMRLSAFCRVKKLAFAGSELTLIGLHFKKLCDATGVLVKPTFDQHYGTVNVYPVPALEANAWRFAAWARRKAGPKRKDAGLQPPSLFDLTNEPS
jgi:hypothetical protein